MSHYRSDILILSMEGKNKVITPIRMGLIFALVYSIILALLHVIGFPIGNTILAVIVSPASIFMNIFFLASSPGFFMIYTLINALVYFFIGCLIGKLAGYSAVPPIAVVSTPQVPSQSDKSFTITPSKEIPGNWVDKVAGVLLGMVLTWLEASINLYLIPISIIVCLALLFTKRYAVLASGIILGFVLVPLILFGYCLINPPSF